MASPAGRAGRTRRGARVAALAAAVAVTTALGWAVVGDAPSPALGPAPPAGAAGTAAATATEAAYPRRAQLVPAPVSPADAALPLGLAPHHDVVRRLDAAQQISDRVSTEVIATTSAGREVVMVTLTAPQTAAEAQEQARLREEILERPASAAGDRELARRYKTPVLLTANVHGDEWEGTDAALRLVEHYATSDDPAVLRTLERSRIHVVVSVNPDGRHDGTRRNTAGFDLNRDLVTLTQPESRGLGDAIVRTLPVLLVDLHGYVDGTLIEPTTPPHGENAEHDLLLPHAYASALGIERAVLALGHGPDDGVRPPQIPLRDWAGGWDGWPPFFVPQYAALHGAVAQTVELPLRVNDASDPLSPEELQRRAQVNTDVAYAALTASIGYADAHREQLLADHIEGFRRAVAGEPRRPVTSGPPKRPGADDVHLPDYPRGFVIPVGTGQRSAPAAARLVDHLVAHGVRVTRLAEPARIGGVDHPAGSYVVDLHQARRGVANMMLAAGTDLSDRVAAMYDVSAWSHGLLWGADVVRVPGGEELAVVGREVAGAEHGGTLEASSTGWVLQLRDPADVQALGSLLARGVAVRWLDDGSVLVPAGAAPGRVDAHGSDGQDHARAVVDEHGVTLEAAPLTASGAPLELPTVGVAGTPEERWALGEMGLPVRAVGTTALNDGLDLSDLDTLYVSAGLSWQDLDEQARAELRAFVSGGGGIVGRGPAGAALNDALGLLDVTAVSGPDQANGIVAVDNAAGPVAGGAGPHTFVYGPTWFTDLGAGVVADQRYAADPLVGGHWRPDARGEGGPQDAAGQAVAVRGVAASGARTVLLGSEPLFRAHPKGQYAVVARALLWTALDG